MSDFPYLQFYAGDWMSDPKLSMCSPATRGIWMDALCAMHKIGRNSVTGSGEELATLFRCSVSELLDALNDLQSLKVAEVYESDGEYRVVGINVLSRLERRPAIPVAIRRAVLAAGKCKKCGATENLSVDHVVPWSKGGAHDRRNFQCLCLGCNIRKGAKL